MRVRLLVIFCLFVFSIGANAQNVVVPPGTVIAYAGKTATPPAGWLPCEGQELTVAQFPALFAVIGTIYGGDGVNRFRLPDLRGRVILGAGTGSGLTPRPLAQVGGEEAHTLTVAEMPVHSHIQTLDDRTGAQGGQNQTDGNGGNVSSGIDNGRTRNEGGGQPHNTMPPFLVLNCLIKT